MELDAVDTVDDTVELSESTRRTVAGASAATLIGGKPLLALAPPSFDPNVLPRLRVIKLLVLAATPGALRPNSSVLDFGILPSSELIVDALALDFPRLSEGGALSLSLRSLERKKLRPRIDLRPLLRSPGGLGCCVIDAGETEPRSVLGEGVPAMLPVELLREKKGIPDDDGRRGLSRLERDLPGLVVTKVGGGLVFWRVVSAVPVLLVDSVLDLDIIDEPSLLERPNDPALAAIELDDALPAKPAMSFELAAIRFHPLAPDAWLPKLDSLSLDPAEARSEYETDSCMLFLGLFDALEKAFEKLHLRGCCCCLA